MLNSYKLPRPLFSSTNSNKLAGISLSHLRHRTLLLRSHHRKVTSLSIQTEANNNASPATSEPSFSQSFISSVGHPPANAAVVQLNLTQRHLTILNLMACAVAISTTWLFFSAIPALMAFKRAANSMANLMDVMREELPDTMAAVRLSGMEISDLTMELSDIGQEITQGVKSSTRAVKMAEEKLRGLTKMTPPVSMQGAEPINNKTSIPVVAKTARGIRESIVKGRSILQMLVTLSRFSGVAFNYLRSRAKARV